MMKILEKARLLLPFETDETIIRDYCPFDVGEGLTFGQCAGKTCQDCFEQEIQGR